MKLKQCLRKIYSIKILLLEKRKGLCGSLKYVVKFFDSPPSRGGASPWWYAEYTWFQDVLQATVIKTGCWNWCHGRQINGPNILDPQT